MAEGIKYRKIPAWKYQIADDYRVRIRIRPTTSIVSKFIELERDGWLLIRRNYSYDGPSGPTHDDSTNMRPALVHDALYQLMRVGFLNPGTWRKAADQEFFKMCREDGMPLLRAFMYYRGVRRFGERHTKPSPDASKIYTAP